VALEPAALLEESSSLELPEAAVSRGVPSTVFQVVGNTLLKTSGVLLSVGLGALALGAVGNTLVGGVDLLLVGRRDSDAVRLALDITSIAGVKAVELGLLGGGDGNSGTLGRGHDSEGAGNEDGGETHLDGFVGVWKLELVV